MKISMAANRDSLFSQETEEGHKRTRQSLALIQLLEPNDPIFSQLGRARRFGKDRRRIHLDFRSSAAPQLVNSNLDADELEFIHRSEIARLLREAANLHENCGWGSQASDLTWIESIPRRHFEIWRREATIEALLALSDGLEGEELDLLIRCALRPNETWVSELSLIEHSLTAQDSVEGRLALARLHLARKAPKKALGILAAATRLGFPLEQSWRLYAGLGRVHESVGGDRLALRAFVVASDQVNCGASPHVDGFFLALSLGDMALASRFAVRLNSEGHEAPEIGASRLALIERLKLRGVKLPWKPSDLKANQLFARWRDRKTGPASDICRDLAGQSAIEGTL